MGKLLRCSVSGCRRLTLNGKCDRHREAEAALVSPWAGVSPEQWKAAGIKAKAAFNEMKRASAQRAELRADLEALQFGAGKMFARLEVPTFAHAGGENGI